MQKKLKTVAERADEVDSYIIQLWINARPKDSKERAKTLKIIGELTLCSRSRIIKTLKDGGFDVDE